MYGQDKKTIANIYTSVDFHKAIAFENMEGAKMKYRESLKGGNNPQ